MERFVCALILASPLLSACAGSNSARDAADSKLVYHNTDYGLTFSLPASWRGYSVLYQQWNATRYDQAKDQDVPAGSGPIIVLRYPSWKANDPYQDISILVYTRQQWSTDLRDGPYAGGCMFEISRNSKYVFAYWSRFNWDDSVRGWQDAGEVVQQNVSVSDADTP